MHGTHVGVQPTPKAVGWNNGCAPSMGANLWGESPLWENRIGLIVSNLNH
jgi:hypothetical protein